MCGNRNGNGCPDWSSVFTSGSGLWGILLSKDIAALLHVASEHDVELTTVEAAKKADEIPMNYFINKMKTVMSPWF